MIEISVAISLYSVLQDDSVQKEGDLYIRSVCFSPDGKYLATGAEDKQIRVCRTDSCKLRVDRATNHRCIFSKSYLQIWDIRERRIRNVFTGHEQDIYSLDFSRDGRIIVSGSGDRTVRIWSMPDKKVMHVIPIQDLEPKDSGVTSVAISPDGRLVAAGSLDKMVRVWDIQTAQPLERLEGHRDSVYSVAFMPDGRTLISGSLDKTIKMWQLGTNERGYGMDRDRSKGPCKMTFTGHKVSVYAPRSFMCCCWWTNDVVGLCFVGGMHARRSLDRVWFKRSRCPVLGSANRSDSIYASGTQKFRYTQYFL